MELIDFQWTERQGRLPDGEPFHEWIYTHASGRVMALIQGPQDKAGGFSHQAIFMFDQNNTMGTGPFIFIDFDSGKAFVESVVQLKVEGITPEGMLDVKAAPMNPQYAALADALKEMTAKFPQRPD